VKLEETFAEVVGRPMSDTERQRLERIRDALKVQDNDALWAIVIALEFYDSLYRRYPEELAAETSKAIAGARQAFASAATAEAARVSAVLSKEVARTSVDLARKMAERGVAMPWVAAAGAALVLFGALCVSAGAVLAGSARPYWASRAGGMMGLVLGAPAGWMAFAGLLPAAGYAGWSGWQRARGEGDDRWVGWMVFGAAVLSALGCVVVLAEVV